MSVEERMCWELKKRRIRQREASEVAGVYPSYFSRMVSGQHQMKATAFLKLCKAYDIDPRIFLEEVEANEADEEKKD